MGPHPRAAPARQRVQRAERVVARDDVQPLQRDHGLRVLAQRGPVQLVAFAALWGRQIIIIV